MQHSTHYDNTTAPHHHIDTPSSAHLPALFLVTAVFFIWCVCAGAWLARLWYYDGQLHPKYPRHDIQPAYIRERLALEAAKAQRESQRVVDAPRWSADVTTLSFEAVQALDDANLRRRIFESRRVSRLPAFEQDDGGDGSEFPDMPVDMTAEAYNAAHFPERPADLGDLGLSEMRWDDWLTVHHDEQMGARAQILEVCREECIQMRLGREAERAVGELWQEAAGFLVGKYPRRFWKMREGAATRLFDAEAGESYPLEGPFGWLTLDTLARLVREDFCVFWKSIFSGQYMLLAGATCFPSGWRLQAHVGHAVDGREDEVLPWENLPSILSYVDEHRDSPPLKRHVAFIQTTRPAEGDPTKKYFMQEGKDFFSGNISFLRPETLNARIERQMFRRLPLSGAIVLTTRVQVESLVCMEQKKLRYLAREIKRWPAHIARLKGRDLWARAVLGYIEQFPMAHDDVSVVDAGELTEEEDLD